MSHYIFFRCPFCLIPYTSVIELYCSAFDHYSKCVQVFWVYLSGSLNAFVLRYGLPVNFQAMLLAPQKKSQKRLREVLNHLYAHLDNSAASPAGADVSMLIIIICLE